MSALDKEKKLMDEEVRTNTEVPTEEAFERRNLARAGVQNQLPKKRLPVSTGK